MIVEMRLMKRENQESYCQLCQTSAKSPKCDFVDFWEENEDFKRGKTRTENKIMKIDEKAPGVRIKKEWPNYKKGLFNEIKRIPGPTEDSRKVRIRWIESNGSSNYGIPKQLLETIQHRILS